jgi:tetratricopeptide (TPR) repeat protein
VLSGRLFAPIVASECVWELDSEKGVVTLHLEKQSPVAWPCLIVDPLVDNDISSLDPCSAFAICGMLEQLQGSGSDRSFALIKNAADRKLTPALARLFNILVGRDPFYESRRDIPAALALAQLPPLSQVPTCQYFLGAYYASAADDSDWWRAAGDASETANAAKGGDERRPAPRDPALAAEWLLKAAAQKHAASQYLLGDLLRDAGDYSQALLHYEALARTDPAARLRIARVLLPPHTARTTRESLEMAHTALQTAARGGAAVPAALQKVYDDAEREYKRRNAPLLSSENLMIGSAVLALAVAAVAVGVKLAKGAD